MSEKDELLARLEEVRAGKKEACSSIMEAEDLHDGEAQKGHIATLTQLGKEEEAIVSELKKLS